MKITSKYIFIVFSSIILISCASQQNYQNSPGGKYIDVFSLSENSKQYFVRPIEWKIKELSIGIDFTLRSHKSVQPNNPVTFCYTLVKDTPFQSEPFLSFIVDDTIAVTPSMVDSLASDGNNRYVRYSSQIAYNNFLKMLLAKRVDMIILDGMSDLRIKMPKAFYKSLDELRRMLNVKG